MPNISISCNSYKCSGECSEHYYCDSCFEEKLAEEYEKGKNEGYKKGYEVGYEDGIRN